MSHAISHEDDVYTPREYPLGGMLSSYIKALTKNAGGTFVFRTGSGRILRDLLLHWPVLNGWEPEAEELCQRVLDAVYPLVGATFARGVEIMATISPTSIDPPDRVDAMSTYVLFDPEKRIERLCFLSPHHALPPAQMLSTPQGVAIVCRPLFYLYHTIHDDKKKIAHPRPGVFELSQRLINELYERPDFVPREKLLLERLKTKIHTLAKRAEQAEVTRLTYQALPRTEAARTTLQQHKAEPVPLPLLLRAVGLSSQPNAARGLVRLLMMYVMNKGYTPELRQELRRIAQSIRMLYPREIIDEAARNETMSPHINPSHHTVHSFHMADLKNAELAFNKRQQTPSNKLSTRPETAYQASLRRSALRTKLSTPSPTPFPQAPTTGTES